MRFLLFLTRFSARNGYAHFQKKASFEGVRFRRAYGMIKERDTEVRRMKSSRSVHPRVSEYAQRDAADLLRDFRLSGDGLSASEAQENRAKYGENRLSGPAPDTVPRRTRCRAACAAPSSIPSPPSFLC